MPREDGVAYINLRQGNVDNVGINILYYTMYGLCVLVMGKERETQGKDEEEGRA